MNTQTAQPTEHTDIEQKMHTSNIMGVAYSVGTFCNFVSAAVAIQEFDGSLKSIAMVTVFSVATVGMLAGATENLLIKRSKFKERLDLRRTQEQSIQPTRPQHP